MPDNEQSQLEEEIYETYTEKLSDATDMSEEMESEMMKITRMDTSDYNQESTLDNLEEISEGEINED